MRLSKVDRIKNTCYAKEGGKLQTFIIEPKEGLNKQRFLNALSLILSEKDVTDYFKSREYSYLPAEKDSKIRKKTNL